ncbi:hypothetical protein [Rhodococcoides yunnanense]|uniref:hypothetical protein n=1 Tax=Rhodococcoides yunnanense TaxID=278209 RepID=UPI000A64AB22|nr:hypothetical protein [Rhodococcus yunnanensis]
MAKRDGVSTVRPLTLGWVNRNLEVGERIVGVEVLRGGVTAEMRKLTISAPGRNARYLVLRSYTDSSALPHAEDWLNREAGALIGLEGTGLPVPGLVAVDSTALYCDYPSLLMTYLPGRTVLGDEGLEARLALLARPFLV